MSVNTEQMFADIHCRQALIENNYFLLKPVTDGCTGQYQSGTAIFIFAIHVTSNKKNILSGDEMHQA
jgi:hypothetical protein